MEIDILYEDDDVMVLDKPADLSVHGDGKRKEKTLADWVLTNRPECEGVGEPLVLTNGTEVSRPGIVHRLDKGTSGVLLIAKHQDSYEHFKKQFQDRHVEKTYRAIVHGEVKEDGYIDKYIGRSKSDFRKKAVVKEKEKGRDAYTEYSVLQKGETHSYLEVRPKTGRMHQIRVHLLYIGHPVVCDPLYAPKKPCPKELSRLALHAHALKVVLPGGEKMEFISEEPESFTAFLAER